MLMILLLYLLDTKVQASPFNERIINKNNELCLVSSSQTVPQCFIEKVLVLLIPEHYILPSRLATVSTPGLIILSNNVFVIFIDK